MEISFNWIQSSTKSSNTLHNTLSWKHLDESMKLESLVKMIKVIMMTLFLRFCACKEKPCKFCIGFTHF